ncbi:MAG: hypothetical protein ABSH20_18985 [Tepidisphaeraceae bacterium]
MRPPTVRFGSFIWNRKQFRQSLIVSGSLATFGARLQMREHLLRLRAVGRVLVPFQQTLSNFIA